MKWTANNPFTTRVQYSRRDQQPHLDVWCYVNSPESVASLATPCGLPARTIGLVRLAQCCCNPTKWICLPFSVLVGVATHVCHLGKSVSPCTHVTNRRHQLAPQSYLVHPIVVLSWGEPPLQATNGMHIELGSTWQKLRNDMVVSWVR